MTSDIPRLNSNEIKVLAALVSVSDGFLTFRGISQRTRMDRRTIRRACRSLTRKELAQYGKGLWTEDGEMFGSGYAATRKGAAYADMNLVKKYELRAWV